MAHPSRPFRFLKLQQIYSRHRIFLKAELNSFLAFHHTHKPLLLNNDLINILLFFHLILGICESFDSYILDSMFYLPPLQFRSFLVYHHLQLYYMYNRYLYINFRLDWHNLYEWQSSILTPKFLPKDLQYNLLYHLMEIHQHQLALNWRITFRINHYYWPIQAQLGYQPNKVEIVELKHLDQSKEV